MTNPLKILLKNAGQLFDIERNGNILFSTEGILNHETTTKRKCINFLPETDIKPGDWVISSSNDKFYIEDTKTLFFQKQPNAINAYYLTEIEYQKSLQTNNATFNIQNAYGSVIGTQAHVIMNYNDSINQVKDQIKSSDSPDKEELQQIISLLEMVVNNQVPVSKGLFSKFSEVMERNSWITSSVTSAILSWLTSQIH